MGGAFAAYERLGDKAEYIGIGHGGSKRYVMKNARGCIAAVLGVGGGGRPPLCLGSRFLVTFGQRMLKRRTN